MRTSVGAVVGAIEYALHPSFVRCFVQPMPVLPEPVDAQQEQQLQQELAELREQLMQVGPRCSCCISTAQHRGN
jgi:hypothetical protein